jgi:propanol-preferring alcohol dehydrogenase
LPVIPGHQIVGIVDKLGAGALRFSVGDRIGIPWLRSTCGVCADCRRGDENLCTHSTYTGWDADGGFAEMAVVPEAFAYALPSAIDDVEAAPLLCAGIIGYRAFRRSSVPAGGRLGLYGFGSSAHITLSVARYFGCQVYVSTRDAEHQKLAASLGAVWVGGASDRPPAPLDAAILFAPAGELVPPALEALRAGGTLAVAGIHLSAVPPLDYAKHLFHEKTLTSVEANTRRDGVELLQLATAIPLRPTTQTFPLTEAARVLALLKHDRLRGSAVLV